MTLFKKSLVKAPKAFKISKVLCESSEPTSILHFTPSGIVIGCDTSLYLYDSINFERLSTLYSSKNLLTKSSYSSERNLIIFSNSKGEIFVSNPEKRLLIRELKRDSGSVIVGLGFSHSENIIYVACKDRLESWDLASGSQLSCLVYEKELTSFALFDTVYAGFSDGTLLCYFSKDSVTSISLDNRVPITSICRIGEKLCLSQGTETIILDNGEISAKLSVSHKPISALQPFMYPVIIQGSLDNFLHFIDINLLKSSAAVKLASPVISLTIDPKGNALICGLLNGSVVALSKIIVQKDRDSKAFISAKQYINRFELRKALTHSIAVGDSKLVIYTISCIIRRNRLKESILSIDDSHFANLLHIFTANIKQFYMALGNSIHDFTTYLIERDYRMSADLKDTINTQVCIIDSYCVLQSHISSAFY